MEWTHCRCFNPNNPDRLPCPACVLKAAEGKAPIPPDPGVESIVVLEEIPLAQGHEVDPGSLPLSDQRVRSDVTLLVLTSQPFNPPAVSHLLPFSSARWN